jgi:hypothetical protein
MDEEMLEPMLKRLGRLERENRRWKLLGLCLIAILGLIVSLGAQSKPAVLEVIAAKKFLLVDDIGNVKAHLGTDAAGVQLALYGPNENRIAFLVGAASAFFELSAGENRASIMTGGDVTSAVSLNSADGSAAFALGPPLLVFAGKDEKTIWSAPSQEASQSGRTWVLWLSVGKLHRASGAWFAKAECEKERTRMTSIAKEKAFTDTFAVCLPDNVHPTGQR